MKRIVSLAIPFGLFVILMVAIYSFAQASETVPSSTKIMGENTKPEQDSPPWYNPAWHYRRPINISNPGAYLTYYQVLIQLDDNNFDFSRAKEDGSDVRFTDNTGKNLISFWVESWDSQNQLAYLWVLVSSISPEPYDTTIYLYYGNPEAISSSDGKITFDFFDNFDELSAGCGLNNGENSHQSFTQARSPWDGIKSNSPDLAPNGLLPWCIISGSPFVLDGILNLPDGSGIKTNNLYQYKTLGFKANYGPGSGKEWAGFINVDSEVRTMIGDPIEDPDDLYLIDHVYSDEKILLPRVDDIDWHGFYHAYELRWAFIGSEGMSVADIDHGASIATSTLPEQVPSTALPITFYSYPGSNATLQVDWVYLRQYRDPEPIAGLGEEQGYVDLEISMEDFPDQPYAGEALTYQLLITNTSDIDAAGVVVTDTLPGEVIFSSADPSQGDCSNAGGNVLCTLNIIPTYSTASITIVVTTTIDGVITNNSTVGSPGFEDDTSDNSAMKTTTVLPAANLAIDQQAYPEVLLPGDMLKYTVTIANPGPSDAAGVSMTDTLPSEVELVSTDPISCDLNDHVLSCPLGSVAKNTEFQVSITATVEATQTMYLTNTAIVRSSVTHDSNLNNNISTENVLVDTSPPEVTWIKPVSDGEIYHTYGGTVNLEATAEDIGQIARIEFWWYDKSNYHLINSDTTEPYQATFNSNLLEPGFPYFFEVRAYDTVGNSNFPDDRRAIYIERISSIFLPFVIK